MRHQRITADMCTVYRRMFVLNGMGTGKTLAVLWAIDYLIRAKQVNRAYYLPAIDVERRVGVNDIP